MNNDKRDIILDHGVPVLVYDPLGEDKLETRALLGKATKQFFSDISLEYHRTAQFLPELPIRNGLLIQNLVNEETYLILASFSEVVEEVKLATVIRSVQCNSSISIKEIRRVADLYGNVTSKEVAVLEDVPVFVESLRTGLEQYDAGMFPNNMYRIYAPSIPSKLLDRIYIRVVDEEIPLKVMHVDRLKFRGVTILDVSTETRV